VTAVVPADDAARLRKARGAFFTPEPIARYITEWAVRSPAERVLEPSCGEAAFLLAAVDHLGRLHASNPDAADTGALDGVEMHPESAAAAQDVLRRAGVNAHVTDGDFFCVEPTGSYDVVIGNPPYVRYQDFTGEARARSRAAALRAGVPLTNLASSWAAFTVHSALFLKPGGRMGLVLPAELLSVNYAAEVRAFLMRTFARVDLVVFTERVFPGVLEEVVLLLADGYLRGPAGHAGIIEAHNAADLARSPGRRSWTPGSARDKWTPSLMPAAALDIYACLTGAGETFVPLETWGDTTLGMVTGNNKYFTLSPDRVAELGLAPADLLRLSPPGSRHLRGLSLTAAGWLHLGERGAATWLFRPGDDPSAAARAYIAQGEADGVPNAYKCRVRQPWWQVPLVPPADLLLTYMNADTPRLSTNRAGVRHLNSVHGVYLREEHREVGRELLSLASLNTLTLLGAETVGRSYGGGMLKLEPREADHLPVPAPALVAMHAAELHTARPGVEVALVDGDLLGAVRLVDDVLLGGALGITGTARASLVDAHARLTARRVARGSDAAGATTGGR
jgi:adenine-specific DNA-methyltransferase